MTNNTPPTESPKQVKDHDLVGKHDDLGDYSLRIDDLPPLKPVDLELALCHTTQVSRWSGEALAYGRVWKGVVDDDSSTVHATPRGVTHKHQRTINRWINQPQGSLFVRLLYHPVQRQAAEGEGATGAQRTYIIFIRPCMPQLVDASDAPDASNSDSVPPHAN